jgi:hypothetical protein
MVLSPFVLIWVLLHRNQIWASIEQAKKLKHLKSIRKIQIIESMERRLTHDGTEKGYLFFGCPDRFADG